MRISGYVLYALLIYIAFVEANITLKGDSPGCSAKIPYACRHSCIPYCTHWKSPPSYNENDIIHNKSKSSCYFIDLGGEVGQSTLGFFGEGPTQACYYAKHTRGIFDPKWYADRDDVCGIETNKVHSLLKNHTWPALKSKQNELQKQQNIPSKEGTLMTLNECSAVIVEPSSHFKNTMESISKDHGYIQANGHKRIDVRHPVGITGCDSSNGLQYNNGPRKRSAHLGKNRERVPSLNIHKLLYETVKVDDYVVVKVDIEGGEYSLIDCLVQSDYSLSLIDEIFVERHDKWLLNEEYTQEDGSSVKDKNINGQYQIEKLEINLEVIRNLGIYVSDMWP
jgi:hypothetical protein